MALVILALSDTLCHNSPGSHGWLLFTGLAYPHLGHLLLGRFNIRRRRGHVIFIVDGFFVGAVVAALDLAVVPSAVLVAINIFNWMIIGGPTLIALGITAMLAGMATLGSSATEALQGSITSCASTDWLASGILICYFLIVARVIHQLVEEMHQQQTRLQAEFDATVNARNLAERALLAVLPPSVGQMLSEKGEVMPTTIDNATLLLVEFDPGNTNAPSVSNLTDAIKICDLILTRHGFELIKTFGHRALAMSRAESGPDNAIMAAREISSHLADHYSLPGASSTPGFIRVAMHCGSVTLGLVQPERLNLELLGEAVDRLTILAATTASQPSPTVVASVAAQRRLLNPAGFELVSGNDQGLAHYLLKLGTPV